MKLIECHDISVDPASPDRRSFTKKAATGLGMLAFTSLGGTVTMLSPRMAHAREQEFRVFWKEEVAILEALGDIVAPGAREAGVANFVDQQLSIEPDDALLFMRAMDVAPPYKLFYRSGLAALDKLSKVRCGKGFAGIGSDSAADLFKLLLSPDTTPSEWGGPQAQIFYHCLRNDAIDVVYGTTDGFNKLGIPYLEHILPPTRW